MYKLLDSKGYSEWNKDGELIYKFTLSGSHMQVFSKLSQV